MRRVASISFAFAAIVAAGPAPADHAPTIVVPGKAGVPVIVNGYDASYAVVEGDWGLSRPGHMPPTVITGPLIIPAPAWGGYYPATGRRPGYGRYEVEPPPDRRLPRPAPSFYREWGTQSGFAPATIDSQASTPSITIEPRLDVEANRPRRRPR
jgi:hypothetical protein